MKMRTGFVSNSSSSSFVLIGKEISQDEIDQHDNVWLVGQYLSDGQDILKITPEIKEHIKGRELQDCQLYSVALDGYDEDDLTQEQISKMRPGMKILAVEKDYHTSDDDMERFDGYYLGEDGDED